MEARGLISSFPPCSHPCPSRNAHSTSSSTSHLFSPTRKMDGLLRWSIEHSTPRGPDAPPPARKDLDPGIIDYMLGKPDAVLMKEALDVALDEKRDEDARVQALDDFEMLVEHIDNANSAHTCWIFSSRSPGTHRPVFRPRKVEDVGSVTIPVDIPTLVRRDQGADPLDYRYRGSKQPFRPKLRTWFSDGRTRGSSLIHVSTSPSTRSR